MRAGSALSYARADSALSGERVGSALSCEGVGNALSCEEPVAYSDSSDSLSTRFSSRRVNPSPDSLRQRRNSRRSNAPLPSPSAPRNIFWIDASSSLRGRPFTKKSCTCIKHKHGIVHRVQDGLINTFGTSE